MAHEQTVLSLKTRGAGTYEITRQVQDFVRDTGTTTGLLTVFCQHTSCSLLIQENADPDVRTDLDGFFNQLVPEGMDWIVHTLEGADDMPAHIKSALTQTSIGIPIANGAMVLGTWQGIYVFEHRRAAHSRQIVLHMMGDRA